MKIPNIRARNKRNHEPSDPEGARGLDDPQDLEDADEESQSPLTWTGGSAAATKAVTVLLLSCLFAGPLALILSVGSTVLTPTGAPSQPATQREDTAADERSAVEAFAQDFVSVWLSTPNGQEHKLAAFIPQISELRLPTQPWVVSSPSIAGIEKSANGPWAVTVSVLVVDQGSNGSGVRRYFRVPVGVDGEKLVAHSLPTPVAAPAVAEAPDLGYENRASASDALTRAATDFLKALLVGGEDVTRYISPGADIRAVSPAPYTSVEVTDVLVDVDMNELGETLPDGQSINALVSATATATKQQEISIQYALTMTVREGRWEVTSVDPAPLLKEAEAASSQGTESPQSTNPTN